MKIRFAKTDRSVAVTSLGAAFTLLEVMIASVIFFTAIFGILQLVTMSLDNARALQHYEPDAAMLASQLSLTNTLSEETASGDFGEAYPGFTWTRDIYQVSSNGLWEADFTVEKGRGHKFVNSRMSVLFFRPQSPETMPKGTLQ